MDLRFTGCQEVIVNGGKQEDWAEVCQLSKHWTEISGSRSEGGIIPHHHSIRGASVMVWSCISASGAGYLGNTVKKYH